MRKARGICHTTDWTRCLAALLPWTKRSAGKRERSSLQSARPPQPHSRRPPAHPAPCTVQGPRRRLGRGRVGRPAHPLQCRCVPLPTRPKVRAPEAVASAAPLAGLQAPRRTAHSCPRRGLLLSAARAARGGELARQVPVPAWHDPSRPRCTAAQLLWTPLPAWGPPTRRGCFGAGNARQQGGLGTQTEAGERALLSRPSWRRCRPPRPCRRAFRRSRRGQTRQPWPDRGRRRRQGRAWPVAPAPTAGRPAGGPVR